ncbi:PPE domain-containing protein [Nocardia huaxiensis]|uniref:PPE domain-containing protein n=1 Tax=Nocardia huaxiensis TaxID=2755382 RepID=UPI001E3302F7|nr:PPE domain-containing protein [Nocardia huaxiensis]UFS95423.1 PPE family protein [Nocardia huaxiensis]
MIEPPEPGFTGVLWDGREPERLARELTTGPGALPMAEAGIAWARLAAGLGAAVLEYEAVMNGLRAGWQSTASQDMIERVSTLRTWLGEAAAAATANAVRAETQAATYELARLAMPNTAQLEAIEQVRQLLGQIGAALGAPVKAIAAGNDDAADAAKAAASRVMREYETATEPLSKAWEQERPPVVAAEAALAAEQAGTPGEPANPLSGNPMGGLPYGGFRMPTVTQVKVPLRAPTLITTPVSANIVETVASHPVTTAPANSTLPYAPMSSGAAAQKEEHEVRSGLAVGEGFESEIGIVSAPAVLGAPEPAPVRPEAVGGGQS